MKKRLTLSVAMLTLFWCCLSGQTNHHISVTSNVFTPNNITINVGDTVTWTNTSGFHNVNGQTGAGATNPVFFHSGPPAMATWVFQHVFNTAGLYGYQCDPHVGFNMFGAITVVNAGADSVDVTFQIDMSTETVDPNGVHIAGAFQGWNPSGTPLSDMGNGIWAVTLSLDTGTTYQYKYINGNAWGNDEAVPMACGVPNGLGGYNRSITVPTMDDTLAAICYAACAACPPPMPDTSDCGNLFFSEYIEGSSFNKALEIFNPTNAAIDLADYEVHRFSNGTSTPTPIALSGMLAAGEVYIIANSSADTLITNVADLITGALSHNGDDALALHHVPTGFNLDIIGVIGFDPGSNWSLPGGGSTANNTLIRSPLALNGETDWTVASAEWMAVGNNVFDSLHAHTISGCGSTPPPSIDSVMVMLQVDMSNEVVSGNGVHVAGAFNGWSPSATALSDMGNGVWATTIEIAKDTAYMYKFINDNAWGAEETVPDSCGVSDGFGGYNRQVMSSMDDTLDLHCFSACDTCEMMPPPVPADSAWVTFQVDMSNEIVSGNGVHVAGAFQGWNPSGTPLSDMGNGVWAVSVKIDTGTAYQYKFINDNAWGAEETVPDSCGVPDGFGGYNREVIIFMDDTLDLHCFSACDTCEMLPPPVPSDSVMVTFQVDMSNELVSANGVHIAGAFQGWNPAGTPLSDMGNGVWAVTLSLDTGSAYQYKYVNGNAWGMDESVPDSCGVPNGLGGYNREVMVPGSDVTLDLHCFAECDSCEVGPPLSPDSVNVTFQVDMSNESVSPNGVWVAGSFNGWNPAATPLAPIGNGIWVVTLGLDTNMAYQYKYTNDSTWTDAEVVPDSCGVNDGFGNYNREVNVGIMDMTLDLHCFSECDTCELGPPPPPADSVEVTLQVDMSLETVSPLGVHVAGAFQGWNPATTPLVDMGGGVWAVSFMVDSGAVYQYKYINGNDWPDNETVPSGCGMPDGFGGFNRFFSAHNDTIIPLHCFSACGICATPPMVDVTFNVNMANEVTSADGIHLAGDFNGWSASATPMTNTIDDVWSVTLQMDSGTYSEYRFVNGNQAAAVETVDAACDTNGNRGVMVGGMNMNLDTVCFEKCDNCEPGGIEDLASKLGLIVYPTVTADYVHLQVNDARGLEVSLSDLTGKQMNTFTFDDNGRLSVDLRQYDSGVYLVSVDKDGLRSTHRIVKTN